MIVLAVWLVVAASLYWPIHKHLHKVAGARHLLTIPFALIPSLLWPVAVVVHGRRALLKVATGG
jgi:hypothetical protein